MKNRIAVFRVVTSSFVVGCWQCFWGRYCPPWWWQYVPPKYWYPPTRLHGITTGKDKIRIGILVANRKITHGCVQLWICKQSNCALAYRVREPCPVCLTACSLTSTFFFINLHNGGWSPNWVHSAHRPLTGLLYLPRVIVRMENLAEWMGGETEVLGENLPRRHYVHHKSHLTRPGIEPEPPRWEASD
jgi:hypothetical protein